MPLGQPGGGEIEFKIGSSAQGIGAQSVGPMNSPVMKDANQFSVAFNQGKSPLTTSLQETCEKINNACNVDAGIGKSLSGSHNISGIATKHEIAGQSFDGFALGR